MARDGMRGYFAELLDYAERMTRAEIATWPKGTFASTTTSTTTACPTTPSRSGSR